MLDVMKLNRMAKKFSSAIPALDNLLGVTIQGQPHDSKYRDHGIWCSKFMNESSQVRFGKFYDF